MSIKENSDVYHFASLALPLCGFIMGIQLYPGDPLGMILTPFLVGFFGYITLKCIDSFVLTRTVALLCSFYFLFVGAYVTANGHLYK